MNPWTIIGWLVLAAITLPAFLWLVLAALTWLAHNAMHRRTRNDPPKTGDIWITDGKFSRGVELHITNVLEDGRVCLQSKAYGGSTASWSDSPERWRERVQRGKLWRTKP